MNVHANYDYDVETDYVIIDDERWFEPIMDIIWDHIKEKDDTVVHGRKMCRLNDIQPSWLLLLLYLYVWQMMEPIYWMSFNVHYDLCNLLNHEVL